MSVYKTQFKFVKKTPTPPIPPTPLTPDSDNNYICSKCDKPYEIHMSKGGFVGRVPLLLGCKHTQCEECLWSSIGRGRVECAECNSTSESDVGVKRDRLRDEYPVNFYLFGVLAYRCLPSRSLPDFTFRPAERKCKERDADARGSALFCADVETTDRCPSHPSNVIEFACLTCELRLCSYCTLKDHKDHSYQELSEVSEEDLGTISRLVSSVGNSLQCLKYSDKKISEYLKAPDVESSSPTSSPSKAKIEIARHFEHFHAKLQTVEKTLIEDLAERKTFRKGRLEALRREVRENAAFAHAYWRYGRRLLERKPTNYDVKKVVEGLKRASELNCFLDRQEVKYSTSSFECGSAIMDIDDSYSITSQDENEFNLIKVTEILPDNVVDMSESIPSLINDDAMSENNSDDNGSSVSKGVSGTCSTMSKFSDASSNKNTNLSNSMGECDVKSEKSNASSFDSLSVHSALGVGSKHNVKVTHLNSPHSFYVTLEKSANIMNRMMQIINKSAQGSCFKVQPKINEIYLVKYQEDSCTQWYRGRVTNIDVINKKYTVFFLDYGNICIVSKNAIRALPSKVLPIPPFTFECKIYNCYPETGSTDWDMNATNYMADIVCNKSLLMIIIDNSIPVFEVDLITFEDLTSVREALIFSGTAIPVSNPNNIVTETQKVMMSLNKNKVIHESTWKFTEKQTFKAIVTHVESVSEVYLVPVDLLKVLHKIKSELRDCYKGHKKGLVYSLKIGMYVAVLYQPRSKPPFWCRAVILEAPESGRGTVKLKLIDYGITTKAEWENIRKLHDGFYATASVAFPVQLADVSSENCSAINSAVRDVFEPFIKSASGFQVHVCNPQHPIKVGLILPGENSSSYGNLCLNGLVVEKTGAKAAGKFGCNSKWCPDSENSQFIEMIKIIQSTDSVINKEIYDNTDNYPGVRKRVEIVSVKSPDEIYLNFCTSKQRFQVLYENMQLLYANCEFKPKSWDLKQPVAVKHQDEYLRGLIEEQVDETTYKVALADFVGEVEVERDNIMDLSSTFSKCPSPIQRCHLANIIPAGGSDKWSALACELLQETLRGKSKFFTTKCGKIDIEKSSLPILLWYEDFIDDGPLEPSKKVLCLANKVLLTNGLALKSPTELKPSEMRKCWDWEPTTPITDREIRAVPTYVDTHGLIYIHDYRSSEALTEMSNRLADHFKDSPIDSTIDDWIVGDVCIARYFLDNRWYRAKVAKINKDSLNIVMVDYGNEEDVPPSDLRKEILFENIPIFATVVYLDEIEPEGGVWQMDDLDHLHAAVVDKLMDVHFMDGHDIHKPCRVQMFHNNDSVIDYLLTECKHLKNLRTDRETTDESIKISSEDSTTKEEEEEEEESDVIVLDDSKTSDEDIGNPNSYRYAPLPTESEFEAVVINFPSHDTVVFEVYSPEEFDADTEGFDLMQSEIQSEAENLPQLKNFTVESPCLVKYIDGLYYRGLITDIIDQATASVVWFVDYGNYDTIEKEDIKEIHPKWLERPLQHYRATIDDIKDIDSAKESALMEFFDEYCSKHSTLKVTARDPLKVKIYEEDGETLIYQRFIEDGTLKEE